MFTGIIECMGIVEEVREERGNRTFTIRSVISRELRVDQSVSHDGVCLTVTHVADDTHQVTAIDETLQKTNLKLWKKGDTVNLERCLRIGDRLDGHWVQGHVDTTGICKSVTDENGSWKYIFEYNEGEDFRTVAKGSITVNGISLTVVESGTDWFSVAIIPYTFEHTNMQFIRPGDTVNLEFDVIGKWVKTWMK